MPVLITHSFARLGEWIGLHTGVASHPGTCSGTPFRFAASSHVIPPLDLTVTRMKFVHCAALTW
jgi:hypothetical protein